MTIFSVSRLTVITLWNNFNGYLALCIVSIAQPSASFTIPLLLCAPTLSHQFQHMLTINHKHNQSLIGQPKIVQGFVKNNNRILDYIYQHSKVVD
ncbi:hypothetical protein [Snodgrassella sp. ESL0253]|uniref:hypothetical protein n=1 Tax=Snodgrassella sp. ESL0253 TaxID=2705031 RepID=UPI00158214AD|nr:hypothetical protein [Snodgrassella sp. ESL0253]NUE65864.1 hypothetical protein [Snodgrassella sp. ESL0253]